MYVLVLYFDNSMTSTVKGESQIPLCLPDNYQWDPETMIRTKTREERSYMYVVEEALKKLRQVKGNRLQILSPSEPLNTVA